MNETLQFATRGEFRAWLEDHSLSEEGVWLILGKAGGPKTIKAGEALEEALPMLGKRVTGYDAPDAVLTAVESRSSSPVRILRDADSYQSPIAGLYPCGEGAGYAGGILSAAADGLRCAEKILTCGQEGSDV